ncbi:MAG TPA: NUDIX domain-containing protein [Candidatus Dormibacteraeota bacterium]|nr:NUDIX domain-containing protein [Candidatus Dormibacteraeota bacterium]
MAKESAGFLLYREREGKLEVLLVHPGGPFWKRKDEGAWSIPKGEIEPGEDAVDVARREFEEELGQAPQATELTSLGTIRQAGGKLVRAWAAPGDIDVGEIRSMTFEMEWPPRSGRRQQFPEIDRAAWFDLAMARQMILAAQQAFIDRLEQIAAPA